MVSLRLRGGRFGLATSRRAWEDVTRTGIMGHFICYAFYVDLASLRLALLAAVTLGYAALVLRMAAQGLLLRFPCFWSYSILLAAKGTQWLAGSTVGFRWTESVILGVKCLVVLEAWWAITREWHERPRRRLFLGFLAAAILAGAMMAWLPAEPNLTRGYVRHALKLHVGLAVFCGGAALTLWTRWEWLPPIPRLAWQHGLILSGHVCSRLVDLINYQAASTTEERWRLYYTQQFLFLGLSLIWLAEWLQTMRREE